MSLSIPIALCDVLKFDLLVGKASDHFLCFGSAHINILCASVVPSCRFASIFNAPTLCIQQEYYEWI